MVSSIAGQVSKYISLLPSLPPSLSLLVIGMHTVAVGSLVYCTLPLSLSLSLSTLVCVRTASFLLANQLLVAWSATVCIPITKREREGGKGEIYICLLDQLLKTP